MFTVDELTSSLEAHEQRKKKKEKTLDQALQTKVSIKDEKTLYSQNFQGRGHGRGSHGNGRGGQGNNHEGYCKEKDSRAKQIGVEEDAVKEEAADQFIPTFSATNVTNLVTM